MKPLKVTQPLPIMFEELIGAVHVNALALVGIDKEEKNEKHLLMAVRGEAIPTPIIVDAAGWAEQPVKPWNPSESLVEANDVPYLYDVEEDDERFILGLNVWIAKQFGKPLSFDVFEAMITKLEMLTGPKDDLRDVFPLAKAKTELAALASASVITAVHGYWYLKRLRLDRPMLPENDRPPPVDDENPFKNFRRRIDTPIARRRKLREDRAEYAAVEKMKSDLLKAAELLSMVREREEKKKALVVCEEEMFELEAEYAKRRKVDREDCLFRMRSGLWGARDPCFDSMADVENFRRMFPDPNSVEDESAEEGTEEPLPLELKHLAFVKMVHIPSVSPFWGIPRLSRRGIVYDRVTLKDVENLLVEVEPVRPRKVESRRSVRLKRIVQIVKDLRAMKQARMFLDEDENEEYENDEDENEEIPVVQLAKELGWWPLDLPYVI